MGDDQTPHVEAMAGLASASAAAGPEPAEDNEDED